MGGFEEADIKAGLRDGGAVLQSFIVVRPPRPKSGEAGPDDVEYVAYFRCSWRRGYHILKTFRHRTDKAYVGRGLTRLVWLIQEEFGYRDPLALYRAGDPRLQQFADVRPADRGRAVEEAPGPPRAAPPRPPWEWPVRYPPRDKVELPTDTEDGDKE